MDSLLAALTTLANKLTELADEALQALKEDRDR